MKISFGETILFVFCIILLVYEAVVITLLAVVMYQTNRAKSRRNDKNVKQYKSKRNSQKVNQKETIKLKPSNNIIPKVKLDSLQSKTKFCVKSMASDEKLLVKDQEMVNTEISATCNERSQKLPNQQIAKLPQTKVSSANALTKSLGASVNKFSPEGIRQNDPNNDLKKSITFE